MEINSSEKPGARPVRRTRSDRKHSSSRERVLREVEARGAASVAELSEVTGLHENTVRGHLDRLSHDGFLRSERTQPAGRGRPSLRWHAVRMETRNPYAGLAIALATTLSETNADAEALMHAAGVAWGAQLAEERVRAHGVKAVPETQIARGPQRTEGDQGVAPAKAVTAHSLKLVFEVMQEQGFAPDGSGRKLQLRSCPILEAARRNPEVVCAAHRGLVEGLIRSRGENVKVELEPFAAPDVCLLRMGSAA